MIKQDKTLRDEFTFSLGGVTAIASFAAAPAIAHNLINKRLDERFRELAGKPGPKSQQDLQIQKRAA